MAFSLPILTFHSLDNRSSAISFSPQAFRRGLSKLREAGHRTLTLSEAAELIRREEPFPDDVLVITFDDGYESVYREAFPVLQELEFSATIFITVGRRRPASADDRLPRLEDRSMLSWREADEMRRCGIEIGAHTLTHPDLTRLSPEAVEAEVYESKQIIEDTLGAAVSCFAYPFGRYDKRSRDVVARHFDCACSDRLGLVAATSDLYALARVDAYYLRAEKCFDLLSTRLFPAYLWSRGVPRQLRRALRRNPPRLTQ